MKLHALTTGQKCLTTGQKCRGTILDERIRSPNPRICLPPEPASPLWSNTVSPFLARDSISKTWVQAVRQQR
jgi:hypothetical protein